MCGRENSPHVGGEALTASWVWMIAGPVAPEDPPDPAVATSAEAVTAIAAMRIAAENQMPRCVLRPAPLIEPLLVWLLDA